MGSKVPRTLESRPDPRRNTIAAPTDTFIDSFVGGAQRTQEAFTSALNDAVRTWTDTVTGFAGGQPPVPDAQVAKTVVGASTQAAEVVTEQATMAA